MKLELLCFPSSKLTKDRGFDFHSVFFYLRPCTYSLKSIGLCSHEFLSTRGFKA